MASRTTLTTLLAASLSLLAGCGGSDPEPEAPGKQADLPTQRRTVGTLSIPSEWPGDWRSEGDDVKHVALGERVGLLFGRGEAVGQILAPIPADAASATRVTIEAMSDGAFALEVGAGAQQQAVKGNPTFRFTKPFVVDFDAPIGAGPLTIRHTSSQHPVLIERIKFLE